MFNFIKETLNQMSFTITKGIVISFFCSIFFLRDHDQNSFLTQKIEKIIRVIPNQQKDIGLNIMSFFHYDQKVKTVTLLSRQEAEQHMLQAIK